MTRCPACRSDVPASAESCPTCGARLGVEARSEEFRIVTIRFYDTAERIVVGHGGGVGTRHGDGLMAVFGTPTPHDDDALRAVRAASELQQALSLLSAQLESSHNVSLLARVGVNTGRALIHPGGASVEDMVTGHAVNLARRFEQNAGAGGILVGEETYSLVRDAVHAEQVEL